MQVLALQSCHLALFAREVCTEQQYKPDNEIISMWGQLSSAAGQFKRTINAVASEIKDAVEEVCLGPSQIHITGHLSPVTMALK